MQTDVFRGMEEIIRRNLKRRGMAGACPAGELEKAARSLADASTVMIVTGFVIRDAMTGETDGPPGAIALASALEGMGKRTVIVTDEYSRGIVVSGLLSRGAGTPVEAVPAGSTCAFCDGLLERYAPSHVIAVERPGRAKDGRCYSMRGEDLSDIVPDTDVLFKKARARKLTTIAVGDGGNEVGMGKVRSHITGAVSLGEKISAQFAADYLVVAGVSNWGAYALAAALSLLSRRLLLHDTPAEARLLDSIVRAGAVDGCTGESAPTVDGLSLAENLEIHEMLKKTVELALRKGTSRD